MTLNTRPSDSILACRPGNISSEEAGFLRPIELKCPALALRGLLLIKAFAIVQKMKIGEFHFINNGV